MKITTRTDEWDGTVVVNEDRFVCVRLGEGFYAGVYDENLNEFTFTADWEEASELGHFLRLMATAVDAAVAESDREDWEPGE